MKPQDPKPVDWLVRRVVESAGPVLAKAEASVRLTEERRESICVLIIDGSDPVARAFYRHALQAGMHAPPTIKEHVVTTMTQPYGGVIPVAAQHYSFEKFTGARLDPGEVRLVVLTLGTLTVLHLGADGALRAIAPSLPPTQPDVLFVAVACWRNDRPEGFNLQAIFRTRKQGEAFMGRYNEQLRAIEASGPAPATVEEQLGRFKPTYGAGEVPVDVQARVFAQVGWLEKNGHLHVDRLNGVVFTFGCEMDLQDGRELARIIGGTSDDLN